MQVFHSWKNLQHSSNAQIYAELTVKEDRAFGAEARTMCKRADTERACRRWRLSQNLLLAEAAQRTFPLAFGTISSEMSVDPRLSIGSIISLGMLSIVKCEQLADPLPQPLSSFRNHPRLP